MKHEKRVLIRRNARELTQEEISNVTGGFNTCTVCTFDGKSSTVDGDVGECS